LSDYHGPSPLGVPVELRAASLVDRGKYLTEAADCAACHTAPGGRPYSGGRAFWTGFGTLYSPNITADQETGIGAWSDADFIRAVHTGVAKDGSHLYPAFPYESYSLLVDEDVLAIKAYLFSLPRIRAEPPPNEMYFPFNQRWLMLFWSFFYNPNVRFEPYGNRSPQWNRGAYLVEALAHCGDCHTPRNLGQALDNRHKFAGGVVDGWSAYNITRDPQSGIGAWSDTQILDYLKNGHSAGRGSAGGPMAEAVDVSLSKLALNDIQAIVAYLRSVPAIPSDSLPAAKEEPASNSHRTPAPDKDPRGKKVFEEACASCHGWSGLSPVAFEATIVGDRAINDPTGANAALAILNGITRSPSSLSMPAFAASYSDEDIASVVNYVTARFGDRGSSLTPKNIADLRALSEP
jgi:mono/diheme cytochrome c family protein